MNIAGVKGEQDWEAVYDINLVRCFVSLSKFIFSQKGVHLGIETAWARMSKEKGGQGGRVVSVSSTCGVTCQVRSMPGRFVTVNQLSTVAQGDMYATPAYTASKHAVTALTRTMGVNKHCDRYYSIYVALIVFLLSFSTSSGWKGRVFLSWLLRLTT